MCDSFCVRKSISVIVIGLWLCGISIPAQAAGPYDAESIMFAQMMIPHHQQAILISQWEVKRGSNPSAEKLAARVISQQTSEISQLKKWIPTGAMTGMDMPMDGMLSASDLAALKEARGKKLDGLYLVDMTLHHQGAIAMARPLTRSKNPEVAALCTSILALQSGEVAEMRRIMVTGK